MKITKKELIPEKALNREWIITNGIGGYSSSTVIGANTRKYHGLLVAALSAPARRYVILSKLDESICIKGKKHLLYTNICDGYVSDGYKHQESFEKEEVPIFTYKVDGVKIQKKICMDYSKNTVSVLYNIENIDKHTKFTIAPIINFRDFHTVNTSDHIDIKQTIKKTKVKLVIDQNIETPVYMNLSDGTYIEHHNDMFYNMCYQEEEKRGFWHKENHGVPRKV